MVVCIGVWWVGWVGCLRADWVVGGHGLVGGGWWVVWMLPHAREIAIQRLVAAEVVSPHDQSLFVQRWLPIAKKLEPKVDDCFSVSLGFSLGFFPRFFPSVFPSGFPSGFPSVFPRFPSVFSSFFPLPLSSSYPDSHSCTHAQIIIHISFSWLGESIFALSPF